MLLPVDQEAFGDDIFTDTGVEEVDSCVESTKRAEKFEIPSVTSSTLKGSRGRKLWVSIIDIGGGIENHLDDERDLSFWIYW